MLQKRLINYVILNYLKYYPSERCVYWLDEYLYGNQQFQIRWNKACLYDRYRFSLQYYYHV